MIYIEYFIINYINKFTSIERKLCVKNNMNAVQLEYSKAQFVLCNAADICDYASEEILYLNEALRICCMTDINSKIEIRKISLTLYEKTANILSSVMYSIGCNKLDKILQHIVKTLYHEDVNNMYIQISNMVDTIDVEIIYSSIQLVYTNKNYGTNKIVISYFAVKCCVLCIKKYSEELQNMLLDNKDLQKNKTAKEYKNIIKDIHNYEYLIFAIRRFSRKLLDNYVEINHLYDMTNDFLLQQNGKLMEFGVLPVFKNVLKINL